MSKLIVDYKFNIGDKVKIDTSLMNRKDCIKCAEAGILNVVGEVISEYNVSDNIWEHEICFGHTDKILTASYLVQLKPKRKDAK